MTIMFLAVAAGIGLAGVPLAMALSIKSSRKRRIEKIERFIFPPAIAMKVRERFPHLCDAQIELVMTALRQYFVLTVMARRDMVSMPSKGVDAAWHEFILFTRAYHAFCLESLGKFLHHTPAEAMSTPTLAQDGIKRAWKLACEYEQIDAKKPHKLPLLFAIDELLKIPGGYRYVLNCADAATSGDAYCASNIGCGSGCGSSGSDADGCAGDGGGCGGD